MQDVHGRGRTERPCSSVSISTLPSFASSYTLEARRFPTMPPITALLHTANDALRLGRTLEMILPCSEIVIIDHHSTDATRRVAREYGARLVASDGDETGNRHLDLASHDWILCMQPGESITESLQASLFEWSALPRESVADGVAFSVFVREQS